jgi:ABC-type Mn2+/Zn2+ transport system ATPase subunit
MWLENLHIRNFRGLDDIEMGLSERANVVVGPNAVGKTTILEAIRLAKAVLAPRTLDEAQQAFMSLGAVAPHTPQQFNYAAVARDGTKPLSISCVYKLSESEMAQLDEIVPQAASSLVQAKLGTMPANQAQLALVQFLSTEQGQRAFADAQRQVEESIPAFRKSGICKLELNISNCSPP